jgi:hypothetical protein
MMKEPVIEMKISKTSVFAVLKNKVNKNYK